MKNRAKCKLCNSIIESFHSTDYVRCKCGEIFVDGGESMKCGCNEWENFLRVDDEGNEIKVKIKEKTDFERIVNGEVALENMQECPDKPNKKELVKMLEEMRNSYENLPSQALNQPVTHYDLLSVLMLLSALFKEFDDS